MTNSTTTSKKPSHIAYHVREGQNDKNFWTRIGVAWQHASDGKGFNIELATLPLDGRIVLRIASENK